MQIKSEPSKFASESLRRALALHQQNQFDWRHREPVRLATDWVERLSCEFDFAGTAPLIGIGRLRTDQFIAYKSDHNDVGLAGVLTINSLLIEACVAANCEWAVAAAVLQGVLVAEQYALGHVVKRITEPTPTLVRRAKELGLVLDRHERLMLDAPPSPFFTVFAKHGGRIPQPGHYELPELRPGTDRKVAWTCRCNGRPVPMGHEPRVLICGRCLHLVAPSGSTATSWPPQDCRKLEVILARLRRRIGRSE